MLGSADVLKPVNCLFFVPNGTGDCFFWLDFFLGDGLPFFPLKKWSVFFGAGRHMTTYHDLQRMIKHVQTSCDPQQPRRGRSYDAPSWNRSIILYHGLHRMKFISQAYGELKLSKKTLPSKPKNNILWLWVFFPQKNNNMDPQNWWISRCMYVLIFFGDIFRFHMLGPFRSVNKNESNMSPPFIQPMPQAETKGTDINVEQLGGRVSNVTEKLNRFQFGCVCWLCFCLPSKIA